MYRIRPLRIRWLQSLHEIHRSSNHIPADLRILLGILLMTNNPQSSNLPIIIIPTQIAAQLKLRAIKEKKQVNFYLELYRAEKQREILAAQSNGTSQIAVPSGISVTAITSSDNPDGLHKLLAAADIPLNESQLRAVELAIDFQSFCLIGPAGTGKTSTVNRIIRELVASEKVKPIGETCKAFRAADFAMVGCAYTRRARDNLARNSPPQLATSTLHNLIEFAPTKKTELLPEGGFKEKIVFEPARCKSNPLPVNLQIIIIDEASMVSTELFDQVLDAIHPMSRIMFIFLGDLAQLPPVFGHAILGFKLLQLPVVELTKVYRQKDGEILDFATQVRQGIQFKEREFKSAFFNNPRLTVYNSKVVESIEARTFKAGHKIQELIHTNQVDPESGDFILCPYNKQFGTIELNNWAADYYDQRDNRKLYTIVAGYQKKHFAIGDKVLIEKRDALIIGIDPNPAYSGRIPPMPSTTINRWGVTRHGKYMSEGVVEQPEDEEDYFNSHMGSLEDALENQEKGSQQASHIITFQIVDTGTVGKVKTTGDINAMELSYCLSVHKSQGSQANTVVIFLSRHHRRLQCRELLYTAATRAINRLMIFADPDSINKCIRTPIIKGDTIEEKAEYFKGLARERQDNNKSIGEYKQKAMEFDDIDIGED
jgi:exodeoxyribonuclease V alpha subunit